MIDTTKATTISSLLAAQELELLRTLLHGIHSAEIANRLAQFKTQERLSTLVLMPLRRQAEVLTYWTVAMQLDTVRALEPAACMALICDMPHDKRADLFKRLKPAEQAALLPGLAHAQREDILKLAAYPEGTAGAIMSSGYASLLADLNAGQAIEVLRRDALDIESMYVCYVVDESKQLQGVVSLRELLVAPGDTRVTELMHTHFILGHAEESKEAIAQRMADYDLLALPIVDPAGVLLGIVTVDEALEVSTSASGRSVGQFGGNATFGNSPDISITHSSFQQIFTARAFWLGILTIFGIITSTFVAAQEEMLSQIVILAAFIAPIIDSGGNTGSQSATLVIRAMALGEMTLRWRDIWLVVRREFPVVIALGLVIGLMEVVLAYFSKGIGVEIMLIVGLSMFICMVLGGLIGALLPFVARRIGADPATLSAPLITSIMDLLGVVIFFSLAYAFMGHLLTGA